MNTTMETRREDTATAPQVMEAIVHDRFGGPEVLEQRTIPVPEPGPNEVLVRVRAAGVDRGVWHLVAGMPYLVRLMGYGVRRPKRPTPGLDLAGTVVAVGDGVDEFAAGDEVMGVGNGSFAEYAVADAGKLVRRPDGLAPELAAAVPVSGITALQAVRDVAAVGRGQRVLVTGASGGVGSYAVQLARTAGAVVTGVASTGKLDLVRSLGAAHVVDYQVEDFTESGQLYDAIIDTGGHTPLRRLRRALASDGTLVIVGSETGRRFIGGVDRQLRAVLWSPFIGQTMTTFVAGEGAEQLQQVVDEIVAGNVRPAVERTYPLVDAATALADLLAGRVPGKAVLTVR